MAKSLKDFSVKLDAFRDKEGGLTIFEEFLYSAARNCLDCYLETGEVTHTPMTEDEYKERSELDVVEVTDEPV